MKPKIEKIIIIDDSTLKIPTIKPITNPFEDIAFIKVLYKQNNVISPVAAVVAAAADEPKYRSLTVIICALGCSPK